MDKSEDASTIDSEIHALFCQIQNQSRQFTLNLNSYFSVHDRKSLSFPQRHTNPQCFSMTLNHLQQ